MFSVEVTRRAVRLSRHWEPEEGRLVPGGGGGSNAGRAGPSTAGRTQERFSQRSRRTMRWQFSGLPWELLGPRPALVTLTYPGDWRRWCPDARAFVRHRKALRERWVRKWGQPVGVWIVEFQPRLHRPEYMRDAPHVHAYVGLPLGMDAEEYEVLQRRTQARRVAVRERGKYDAHGGAGPIVGGFSSWLRDSWWEIVGSEERSHRLRGVDVSVAFWSQRAAETADRMRTGDYFWRESGKYAQKAAPDGFGGLAWYGRWGKEVGFLPSSTRLDDVPDAVYYGFRRMVEDFRYHKLSATARAQRAEGVPWKWPRRRLSRFRDGVTIFDLPQEDARRMFRLAERLAYERSAPKDTAKAIGD